MRDDPVRAWLSLPRRIYLDTSTLQKLYDFGGEIFESEPFELVGRAAQVQGLADEIRALQMIFMASERAMFEFVVTEASLREVVNRTRPLHPAGARPARYLVHSVRGRGAADAGHDLREPTLGMISAKDRRLLQEALDWRCEAFMTMERRWPAFHLGGNGRQVATGHLPEWERARVWTATGHEADGTGWFSAVSWASRSVCCSKGCRWTGLRAPRC